jgi:hypothetical protein
MKDAALAGEDLMLASTENIAHKTTACNFTQLATLL